MEKDSQQFQTEGKGTEGLSSTDSMGRVSPNGKMLGRKMASMENETTGGDQQQGVGSHDVAMAKPFRVLPDIIEEAVEKGARVIITKTGFEVDGFYKLGALRLEPASDSVFLWALDKKDKRVAIKKFDDLAKLNFEWWKKSRDKSEFVNPGKEWLEEFVRLGLVQRQVIYVPAD